MTILYFSKLHTTQDHACELDKGKFLKFAQKSFIATAVKVAPLQTGSELLRNVQDSPTKVIDQVQEICGSTCAKVAV
jgi:hypothetical protein